MEIEQEICRLGKRIFSDANAIFFVNKVCHLIKRSRHMRIPDHLDNKEKKNRLKAH